MSTESAYKHRIAELEAREARLVARVEELEKDLARWTEWFSGGAVKLEKEIAYWTGWDRGGES